MRVPGKPTEVRVDLGQVTIQSHLQDAGRGIVEEGSQPFLRPPERLLCLTLLRDVPANTDDPYGLSLGIPDQSPAHIQPGNSAVTADQAPNALVGLSRRQQLRQVGGFLGPVVGIYVLADLVGDRVLRRFPDHLAVVGVGPYDLQVGRDLGDADRGVLEDGAELGFRLAQRLLGLPQRCDVVSGEENVERSGQFTVSRGAAEHMRDLTVGAPDRCGDVVREALGEDAPVDSAHPFRIGEIACELCLHQLTARTVELPLGRERWRRRSCRRRRASAGPPRNPRSRSGCARPRRGSTLWSRSPPEAGHEPRPIRGAAEPSRPPALRRRLDVPGALQAAAVVLGYGP